ncbi:MAG TPA: SAM-dependent chlorinase/fluorinase [Gaiellales bacterium]|nr:SAM-dependent chlorinase/fluorinase [Gaiellales bacterium]
MAAVVTLLSDFGTDDAFAGICHGVIARLCPDAQVIHITHGIEPTRVEHGARLLADAVAYMPVGVHVAVVDPGVGSQRQAVALRSADGRIFVGPDNGLLLPAADACGGVVEAVAITNPGIMLHPVSRTFHGRDVFAPAAARIAAGLALGELGEPLDPALLVRSGGDVHHLEGSLLEATVLAVDRFGNVQLGASPDALGGLFRPGSTVEVATKDDRYYARCAETFADVDPGELVLYEDASGLLSLAVNHGDAAEVTAATVGGELRIEFAPGLEDDP